MDEFIAHSPRWQVDHSSKYTVIGESTGNNKSKMDAKCRLRVRHTPYFLRQQSIQLPHYLINMPKQLRAFAHQLKVADPAGRVEMVEEGKLGVIDIAALLQGVN